MNTVNQNAKAQRSAWLCFALALLTMATTAWFVVEGINATEPDSPARWAKVASGVLLLVLEASAFGLAGQWPEHSKVLRALGWAVLVLEITLMSVSQISIGMTAAKSSSGGDTTISALEKKSAGARENAKRLQSRADELRATGRTANIRLAASEEKAAIKQTAIADEAETDAQKRRGNSTGTPVVEIVGKTGLIALSIALSVALSLSGIVLMHVAGSLWRRASGALPVDVQILELLQRIHGAPAATVSAQTAATPAPASSATSYRAAGTVAPATKDATAGFSYSTRATMAGAGALAALTAAPMVQAAPAQVHEKAPAAPVVTAPPVAPADAPAQGHPADDTNAPVQRQPADEADAPTQGQLADDTDAPAQGQPKQRKKTVVPADGSKLDTGTTGKASTRYHRIKVAVKAGKLKPSMRAIQAAEGGGDVVITRYLQALEKEGVTVRKGRGWTTA
jgi:hypothetical protein